MKRGDYTSLQEQEQERRNKASPSEQTTVQGEKRGTGGTGGKEGGGAMQSSPALAPPAVSSSNSSSNIGKSINNSGAIGGGTTNAITTLSTVAAAATTTTTSKATLPATVRTGPSPPSRHLHSSHHYYHYGAPPPPPPPPSSAAHSAPRYDTSAVASSTSYVMQSDPGHRLPGPYTTAQYDSSKISSSYHVPLRQPNNNTRSQGSSPSHPVLSRDQQQPPPPPPPPHYNPHPHAPPLPPPTSSMHVQPKEIPPPTSSYAAGYRDDHHHHHHHQLHHPHHWPSRLPPPPPPIHRYYDTPPPPPSHHPHPPPIPSYSAPHTPHPPSIPSQAYHHSQPPKPPPSREVVHAAGPYRFSDPTLRRQAEARIISPTERYNEVDGREGATSPSQIESNHREEVTSMGCTCKKTKCLKLYCQCFAVKIYCGDNCRCLTCSNTAAFEKERKEAIRSILSRNPCAFDTKFKKTNGEDRDVADVVTPAPPAAAAAVIVVPNKVLAHKVGCKCRKSACMKKYCECYAGNVKCSSNCRCVSCKNMPPACGPSSGAIVGVPAVDNSVLRTHPKENSRTANNPAIPKPGERWMVNAAQNLAFLKHGSPASDKRKPSSSNSETVEVTSMPSLASDASPVESKGENASAGSSFASAPSINESNPPPTSEPTEKTAVNALLMAAMAMTEMSGVDKQNPSTPPRNQSSSPSTSVKGRQVSPPETTTIKTATPFETPKKSYTKTFRSPKRKSDSTVTTYSGGQRKQLLQSQRSSSGSFRDYSPSQSSSHDEDEDSPKRENPSSPAAAAADDEMSCHSHQKVKRSRIGQLSRQGSRNLQQEMTPKSDNNNKNNHRLSSTSPFPVQSHNGFHGTSPNNSNIKNNNGYNIVEMTPKGPPTIKKDLTPVTARCIDFRRMNVRDTSSAERSTNHGI